MKREFLPLLIIGLALVVGMVFGILYIQRGAHLELRGSVQKVRTLGFEDSGSVAVIDFRFTNSADYPFVVRNVDVTIQIHDGSTVEGTAVSEVDAARLFEYYPVLGQKFNDTLLMKTKIAPHESMDRMVAVRFEVPEKLVQERKQLLIRVEDVDGAVSEIVEKPR